MCAYTHMQILHKTVTLNKFCFNIYTDQHVFYIMPKNHIFTNIFCDFYK